MVEFLSMHQTVTGREGGVVRRSYSVSTINKEFPWGSLIYIFGLVRIAALSVLKTRIKFL